MTYLPALRLCCDAQPLSLMGHSRPMHSGPMPINVRCYSNSDIIVRRSEVTLTAATRHLTWTRINVTDIGCTANRA